MAILQSPTQCPAIECAKTQHKCLLLHAQKAARNLTGWLLSAAYPLQAGKKKCSPACTAEPNSGNAVGYGIQLENGYDATSAIPPSLSFWPGTAPPSGGMEFPQGFSNMPFNQFEFMASMEPNPEGGEQRHNNSFVSAFAQHSAQMGREPQDGGFVLWKMARQFYWHGLEAQPRSEKALDILGQHRIPSCDSCKPGCEHKLLRCLS